MANTQTCEPNFCHNFGILQNNLELGDTNEQMFLDGLDVVLGDCDQSSELWNFDFLSNISDDKTGSSGDESPLNSPSLSSDSAFSNDSPLRLAEEAAVNNSFEDSGCSVHFSSSNHHLSDFAPSASLASATHFSFMSEHPSTNHQRNELLSISNDLVINPASAVVCSPTTHLVHDTVAKLNQKSYTVATENDLQVTATSMASTVLWPATTATLIPQQSAATPLAYTLTSFPAIVSAPAHQIIVTNAIFPSVKSTDSRHAQQKISRRTDPYPKIRPKMLTDEFDLHANNSSMVMPPSPFVSAEIVDEKPSVEEMSQMKRQTRMLKNREAANLSRKKKKEYVDSLEERLKQFTEENKLLKRENEYLKTTLFSLQSENEKLRVVGDRHDSSVSSHDIRTKHSKIFSSTVSKTAICLLTFMFVCALNLGPYWTYFYPPQIQPVSKPFKSIDDDFVIGRRLLSVEDKSLSVDEENAFVQHDSETMRSKRSPVSYANESNVDCASYFNKSESLRLADELNSWAIRYESIRTKKLETKTSGKRNFVAEDQEKQQRRKLSGNAGGRWDENGRRKIVNKPSSKLSNVLAADQRVHKWLYDFENFDLDLDLASATRQFKKQKQQVDLQLYLNDENHYFNFMEALRRRDDTFYVISFQREYLLLPALAHNRTARPRMSLVMPALPLNESMQPPPNHVAMMQIECEVTGTSLLHLPDLLVPKSMKQTTTENAKKSKEPLKAGGSVKNKTRSPLSGKNSSTNSDLNLKSFNETTSFG